MTIPLENAIDSSRERLTCFRCHAQLPNDSILVDYRINKITYGCRACGNSGWRSFGAVFTTVNITDIIVYIDCPIRTSGVTRVTRPSEADQRQAFRQGVWDSICEVLQRQPRSPNAPIFRSAPPSFREVIGNDAAVDEVRRSIANPAPSPPPVAVIDCENYDVAGEAEAAETALALDEPMAPADVQRLENDIADEFARRRGGRSTFPTRPRDVIQAHAEMVRDQSRPPMSFITGRGPSASIITDSGTALTSAVRSIVQRNVERQATEAPRQQAHPLDILFEDTVVATDTIETVRKKQRDDGYDIANDPNSEE